ncbi:DegT/DnrJ/EryC1/StrS family aminotransferase [bacterium]|nr:DegT/DnrJ/EryC1/StrS family aminotransferase [bacterium]
MHNQSLNNILSSVFDRDYVRLTKSGSFAIIIALHAAKLPTGSKVIMPAICCPSVLSAIQMAGFLPQIADVNEQTLCMEVNNIKDVFDDNCSAVIAIHSYGRPCDLDAINLFCKKERVLLIEDACLGYGYYGQKFKLGAGGDISVISFGYDKPLECGGGGAVMTNDTEYFTKIDNMVNENPYLIMADEHQCNLIDAIKYLPSYVEKRIEHSNRYIDLIDIEPKLMADRHCAYWRLPIIVNGKRDSLLETAKQNDLIITNHYRSLSGFMTNLNTPTADKIDENIINLFTRPDTKPQYIEQVSVLINSFYNDD